MNPNESTETFATFPQEENTYTIMNHRYNWVEPYYPPMRSRHSTKKGVHHSNTHTKARKAKRRNSKRNR